MDELLLQDKQLNILVVDDNTTGLLLLREALEEVQLTEFVLTCVQRLDKALKVLHEKYFDAVLLHLGLPDSQGLETFVRLQREHPVIPILILSGRNDEAIAIQAVQSGAQDFVSKDNIKGIPLARSIRYAIQRKLSEQRLVAFEASYRRLFETAQDGILILDADYGKITDANPYLEKLLGYSITEFMGKRLWEIAPFRDKAANQAAFRTLQEKGYIRYDDLPLITKDGKRANVEFVSNVYTVGNKQVIQCNIRDITERKLAGEQLRKLSQAVEQSPISIMITDLAGDIEYVNRQFEQLTGYALEEIQGKNPRFLQSGETSAETYQELWAAISSGREWRGELLNKKKTGDLFWEFASFAPIFSESGQITHYIATKENITERKAAERELQESKEKFELLVDNITDTFWIRSTDMKELHYLSPAFERMWGVPAEVQYDSPDIWSDFVVPEDRERVIKEFSTLTRDAPSISVEYRIRRADGEIRWLQSRGYKVRNDAGELIYLAGIVSDITERKQAEQERKRLTRELQQQRQRLDDILENVPAIVWEAGAQPDGLQTLDYISKFAETMLGFSIQEWLSTPDFWQSITHPEDKENYARRIAREFTSGQGGTSESRLMAKDGRVVWIESHTEFIHDPRGNIIGLRGVSIDITERKQAELELARFAAIVESSSDAIFSKTLDGVITSWNAGAKVLFGYSRDEAIGRSVYTLIPPDRSEEEARLLEQISRGERVANFETVRVCKDERRIDVSITLSPINNNDGAVIGASSISRDISERKKAEEVLLQARDELETRVEERTSDLQKVNVELQSAREMADSANLAKSEFLSRMSHEVRTPLNAILGFGQILDRKDLDPLAKESVGYILKGGRHLLDLINEVLDIARVEAGRLDLSLEPIALADIVPEVCSLVKPIADERSLQVEENTSQLLDIYVRADHQRLKQVLINLLSNAIKFNREGGRVEISCEQKPEGRVALAVRDTGLGIAPEDLLKLFTPFEGLGVHNSEVEGSGLGLVLSQRLMSAMNGTLAVKSVVARGTTFTIELLQAAAPKTILVESSGSAQHRATATLAPSTYSVLSIEDNRSNLRLMEALFEGRPDVELISAIQGSIGLELALRHEPDLILLDLNLPDMHGSKVLERLQQSAITRDIPVVIISADATPKQIKRLMEAGTKDYLTKPIDVDGFLQMLDKFLQPSAAPEISKEKGSLLRPCRTHHNKKQQ